MRWLVIFFVMLMLFSGFGAWLKKIGLGRLPGDFTLRFAGREFYLPLATSLLLSLLTSWFVHWV
jgi:hypothetical protein